MKKLHLIESENFKLILIAIVLAALILLIPFYIKAQNAHNVDFYYKVKKQNRNITWIKPNKKETYYLAISTSEMVLINK